MQNHRYITSTQIADWASTKEAESDLPKLIRRLIHATVNSSSCDFPAGDSINSSGFDGELFCRQETPWTPSGQSYWEVSRRHDVTKKANEDYDKRTDNQQTDEITRNQSTLIIVTARKWSQKKKWVKKKCEANEWQAIRAFDADDLEQWLEQCPAVALQFAEELGISGFEVESITKYWESWSYQASPAITVESFHASREHSRDRLLAELNKNLESNQSGLCSIKADSIEESVAFVCAALLDQPDLANASLVVTESAGWHYVDKHPSLKIAIAARPEIAERPSSRPGLTVIIPHAAGDMSEYFPDSTNQSDTSLIIERPDIYAFEKALMALGFNEGDAHRSAMNTGRSWSVYRRRFAKNPAIRSPAWLDTPQAVALSTLCLLGAWSDDHSTDKDLVSSLADRSYEEVEKELRYLSQLNDAPVLKIGTVWKAKSDLELLDLFGDRITDNELERFFELARQILSTPAPELELPNDQRWTAQIYGKVRPQSGLLIDSLCDTLVKLAVRGAQLPHLRDAHIESRVAKLVRQLLHEADEIRWLSLSSHLTSLAEAAPESFLKAMEWSLAQPNVPVGRLITESGGSTSTGQCWHAGLLWALESLAWPPKQFPRVALILAKLILVPYSSNWGNTPMSSLVGLFRSWLPQTGADIQQRIATLDLLIAKEPEIAFNLLDSLVNVGSDMATPAHRPKWRNDDAGFGRSVTYEDNQKMLLAAADRLLELAVRQPQRITRLIKKLFTFDAERIQKTLSLIGPYTEAGVSDEDREIIRAALRKRIHWYRNYSDKDVEALDKDLNTIERLYQNLEPNDLLVRHRWLFANNGIDVPWRVKDNGYNQRGEVVDKLRFDAVKEIHVTLGIEGIEKLALSCGNPYWVGVMVAKLGIADDVLVQWIVDKVGEFTVGEPLAQVTSGLLNRLEISKTLELVSAVVELGQVNGWDTKKITNFLMLAPRCTETWNTVASYGFEVENAYWSSLPANFWLPDADTLHFVLNRLLAVNRPRSALQICQNGFGKLEATVIAEMLERIIYGEEPEGPLPSSWHIGEALEKLQALQSIDKGRLIRLEFGLFPALCYGSEQRAKTLYEGLMSDPGLFTELLCILYKPRNGEREKPPTEAEQTTAETARKVLRACTQLPGMQTDGSINSVIFIEFIDSVRGLCKEADRLEVCDSTLGQILAHAPTDADGIWPCQPVREVLERPELEDMRNGFQIGVRNKRGVTTRAPCEGGHQERSLADFYHHQAQALSCSHVYLAATLEELASNYERDGRREDVEAKFRREGF
jgi:hypothetical protein